MERKSPSRISPPRGSGRRRKRGDGSPTHQSTQSSNNPFQKKQKNRVIVSQAQKRLQALLAARKRPNSDCIDLFEDSRAWKKEKCCSATKSMSPLYETVDVDDEMLARAVAASLEGNKKQIDTHDHTGVEVVGVGVPVKPITIYDNDSEESKRETEAELGRQICADILRSYFSQFQQSQSRQSRHRGDV